MPVSGFLKLFPSAARSSGSGGAFSNPASGDGQVRKRSAAVIEDISVAK